MVYKRIVTLFVVGAPLFLSACSEGHRYHPIDEVVVPVKAGAHGHAAIDPVQQHATDMLLKQSFRKSHKAQKKGQRSFPNLFGDPTCCL